MKLRVINRIVVVKMLRSELRMYVATSPLGHKLGTINDVIVNTKTWDITDIQISKFFKKLEYNTEGVKEFDKDARKMIIKEDAKSHRPQKTTLEHMSGRDLMKRRAFSKDEKEVGFIYDLDIAIEPQPWKIKKVLIQHGPTKRRLRESPEEIASITNKIVLMKEYEKIEE